MAECPVLSPADALWMPPAVSSLLPWDNKHSPAAGTPSQTARCAHFCFQVLSSKREEQLAAASSHRDQQARLGGAEGASALPPSATSAWFPPKPAWTGLMGLFTRGVRQWRSCGCGVGSAVLRACWGLPVEQPRWCLDAGLCPSLPSVRLSGFDPAPLHVDQSLRVRGSSPQG